MLRMKGAQQLDSKLRSWHCSQGLYGLGSYSYTYVNIPCRQRKSHQAEFWIFAYIQHHLSPRKTAQSQVMSAFAVCDITLFSTHQFHVACFFYSLHGRRSSSLVTNSCWYAWYTYFPHDLPFVEGLQLNCYVESPPILPGVDQLHLDVGQSSVGANLNLPFPMLNQNLLQIRSSSPHRRRQL